MALFKVLPWTGGLNTSLDESMISPTQLVTADNVTMESRTSKKKRDGIHHGWDDETSGTLNIVGLLDFWYGTAAGKTQKYVSVGSDGTFKSTSTSGTHSDLTDAGTGWTGTITNATMTTFNNLAIIAGSGSGNVLKKWSGSGNVDDLDGTPPVASIVGTHLGRIFANDKTNVDRLHYCTTHDHTEWNGTGDSGAIDIGVGDGDPTGITAIFPTFRGDLYVAKRTKLYRILTVSNDPAQWIVQKVSDRLGCISHNSAVAVEDSDIFFISDRGIHSLATTEKYGDTEVSYVSTDIQKTFRDDISLGRLQYSAAAYDSSTNTVAFALTEAIVSSEDTDKSKELYGSTKAVTSSINNVVYIYNILHKAWFRWPGLSAQSLINVQDSSDNKQRFLMGSHISRISRSKNGTNYDLAHDDTNTAIKYKVKTGYIFPNNSSTDINRFLRLHLHYRPVSSHTLTVNATYDNQSQDSANSFSFNLSSSTDLLGSTFILGQSAYGVDVKLAPYSYTMQGQGRGFQVEITQGGTDEPAEIEGFSVEFEPLTPKAEVSE